MKRYNHLLTLGFSVITSKPDASDLTFDQMYTAIDERVKALSFTGEGFKEAVLPPHDTFEEKLQPPPGDFSSEGWDLFQSTGTDDEGIYRIERIDEAEVFPDDITAWKFVAHKASCGSRSHKAVLDFIREENPTEWTAMQPYVQRYFNGTEL